MSRKIVKGKLVFLRAPEKRDMAEYTAMARASEKSHRGLIKMSRTQEEFDAYLERCTNPVNANFLICRVSDKAIAGMINLSQIFYGPFENAYLGYGLGSGFIGQGLMTEAVALILKHAFKDLKLHRVEANVQPDNLPSIAVLKRNGFTKEGFSRRYLKVGGRWRDHERWAIIKEDWKTGQNSVQ